MESQQDRLARKIKRAADRAEQERKAKQPHTNDEFRFGLWSTNGRQYLTPEEIADRAAKSKSRSSP